MCHNFFKHLTMSRSKSAKSESASRDSSSRSPRTELGMAQSSSSVHSSISRVLLLLKLTIQIKGNGTLCLRVSVCVRSRNRRVRGEERRTAPTHRRREMRTDSLMRSFVLLLLHAAFRGRRISHLTMTSKAQVIGQKTLACACEEQREERSSQEFTLKMMNEKNFTCSIV